MDEPDNIICLDSTSSTENLGGGKFFGLCQINKLLHKYNQLYNLNLQIPKTFAIKTQAFSDYNILQNGVPEELVNQAMNCLVKCGGCVAVRSSADIEDKSDNSHSGEFDSVLFVKTKQEMRLALEKVYNSAKAVPQCNMGIVIQKMINTPAISGVAYSESWHRDPFDVINFVEGKVADNLVTKGDSSGKLFAIGKYCCAEDDNPLLNLQTLNDKSVQKYFMQQFASSPKPATPQDLQQFQAFFTISALINSLEEELHHPIDMEFAIDEQNQINILQQRPYNFPQYFRCNITPDMTTIYSDKHNSLAGNISYIDNLSYSNQTEPNKLLIYKNNDTTLIFTPQSLSATMAFAGIREHTPFAVNGYNHVGNMARENLDLRMVEIHGPNKLDNLKDGDWINIDLVSGNISHKPHTRDNTNNLIYQNKKSNTRF